MQITQELFHSCVINQTIKMQIHIVRRVVLTMEAKLQWQQRRRLFLLKAKVAARSRIGPICDVNRKL